MSQFTLLGADNLKLNVRDFLVEDVLGIVLCVHGMCEHSNRYADFAKFLNEQGYALYVYDHRGHGASILENETQGYLGKDGFNKLVTDLDVVVTYIKDKYPDKKLYILGHSMGSFVTQRYIQQYDKVNGVILSGSNYGTSQLRFGKLVSKLSCIFKGEKTEARLLEKLSFGSFNKFFAPNRTDFDWLNRDEVEVDKYIDDIDCGFTCSNQFYYDFFSGLLELSKEKNFSFINRNLPIFIISGSSDPVGNHGKGVEKLFQIINKNNNQVELKLYPEARHEILNEKNKLEVYQDIVNWLITNNK